MGRSRSKGHQVIGLDLKMGYDVVKCSLKEDVDCVFHLAAQTDARSPDALTDAYNNIMSAVRVMSHYKKKVVFTSSSAVNYLNSPYAISKKTCEDYAKLYGCGVVRLCNIFGAGGRSFIDLYRTQPFVNANLPGTQVRTYASVQRACEALVACKPGELKILSGDDMTVKQIIEAYYPDKEIRWQEPKGYDIIDGRQIYGV